MMSQITDIEEKMRIARLILESLFDWFEIPETREKYIKEAKKYLNGAKNIFI